jgi:uncharacterized protein YyaL (SSP411 family)
MSCHRFSPRPNRAAEIHWRHWGPQAFEEARTQGKPILLAISAVWCHWCHVMDETTYSDERVIAAINERYIPVRVDNDRRPDVNLRYNMGGWPTTVFLTPEGEVLYGGTYIPPHVMLEILKQVAALYADPANRLSIARRVADLKQVRAARSHDGAGEGLDPRTAHVVRDALWAAYDSRHGGFGNEQKFPHVPALHFLLDDYSRSRDDRAKTMVQHSLHAMAEGGMYDHVAGGFFRYSTTADFSVPHYEKMLEDLAGLLHACARAGAMFSDEALCRVAIDTKRYMDEHLWQPQRGAYGGSQDADEEYYALDAAGRAGRPEPYVDPTIYTAWNAQAARSLLLSAPLLVGAGSLDAEHGWTARALCVLDTLWTRLGADGLFCRYDDGAPHVRGLLADQAWSAWAALAAFSVSGDGLWLQRAGEVVEHCEALYDASARAYADRIPDTGDAGKLAEPVFSFEENSLMAQVVTDYAALSGHARYLERARTLLERWAGEYASFDIFAATYGSAVLNLFEPPIDAIVLGNPQDEAARTLRQAALRVPMPPTRVNSLDPSEDPERAARLGHDGESGITRIYLCRGTTCFAHAASAEELKAALEAAAAPRTT